MAIHEFILIIEGIEFSDEDAAGALIKACEPTGFGSFEGTLHLEFDSEADTFFEAVMSAIRDVHAAGIGVSVIRIEPDDMVSASDIARRTDRTRESVRLLIAGRRGPGGFPAPVARTRQRSPLWRWTDVAAWFVRHGLATADLDTARDVAVINAALEIRRHTRSLREATDLLRAVG